MHKLKQHPNPTLKSHFFLSATFSHYVCCVVIGYHSESEQVCRFRVEDYKHTDHKYIIHYTYFGTEASLLVETRIGEVMGKIHVSIGYQLVDHHVLLHNEWPENLLVLQFGVQAQVGFSV